MSSKSVSGCIVTYNNIHTIGAAISSLLEFTKGVPFSLTIVDNGSTDGTVEYIKENFPDVELIISNKNVGFGEGHNSVLPSLNSDYHAIINPDVILRDDVITKMADYMDENADIGLLSPQIRFPDGRPQILGKRAPTPSYLIASRMRNDGNPCKALCEYAMLDCDMTAPTDIQNATGCFMFIRTPLLKKLGGFDKRYFMYFEDCDLTREVCRVSRCVYYPDAVVYHEWGRESKKNSKLKLIQLISMLKYFSKWGIKGCD